MDFVTFIIIRETPGYKVCLQASVFCPAQPALLWDFVKPSPAVVLAGIVTARPFALKRRRPRAACPFIFILLPFEDIEFSIYVI